jgi:alpha-galactosidase
LLADSSEVAAMNGRRTRSITKEVPARRIDLYNEQSGGNYLSGLKGARKGDGNSLAVVAVAPGQGSRQGKGASVAQECGSELTRGRFKGEETIMAKIVLIGAGSGFGGRLAVDILSYPELQDSVLGLVDINAEAVAGVTRFVERAVLYHNLPTRVIGTTERREVLAGADFVIVSIAVGGPAYDGVPFYYEVEIPKKYGVDQSVADTVGPGGVFRTLRTAPEMLAICRDMEELCPDALMLNYTNPMAMLTWVMTEASGVRNVGLCHSVQGTHDQIAGYIGMRPEEITSWVAGINHMAWFLRLERATSEGRGEDLYPRLRKAMDDPEIYARDTVRFEVMRHFGYFVTESTPHMSEYVPYFRKRPELREQFGLGSRTPDPKGRGARRFWMEESPGGTTVEADALRLQRSNEYASGIIHACWTNTLYRFNGNVRNSGIISNLPEGCCVEVPCMVDGSGVNPCAVGALPTQLAALNQSNVAVQQLTVEAVLERDLDRARMAVMLDPLTAAVCSLDEAGQMFDELLEAERDWLEPFFPF